MVIDNCFLRFNEDMSAESVGGLCRNYFGGRCQKDTDCRYKHQYARCRNSNCSSGRCRFLHVSEGDIEALNNRGGVVSNACMLELVRLFSNFRQLTVSYGYNRRYDGLKGHCYAPAMRLEKCPWPCSICNRISKTHQP